MQMHFAAYIALLSGASATAFVPSEHWGQTGPWRPAGFGIEPNGLPEGCSYEQIHVLQRHTERYPSGGADDSGVLLSLASKIQDARSSGTLTPTGALEFLNHWEYILGKSLLTGRGAASSARSGADFWAKYGRLLYDTPEQVRYNVTLLGNRVKPVFRTTNQERMAESAKWWLSGFFGSVNASSSAELFDLVIIPEGGNENNTLAAYDSCPSLMTNGKVSELGQLGDREKTRFIERYTRRAQKRLNKFLGKEFDLTATDVFAMQRLCAYETAALGQSDFCNLFKKQDWLDFDYALGLSMYSNAAYGNPTGRAQGLGYLQELIARLQHRTIGESHSSINQTFDGSEAQFGHLDQPMFFDATHDTVIVSLMTAMGLSFFNYTKGSMPSDIKKAPANPRFKLSDLTPFGAHLHTEVISCSASANMTFTKDQIKYGHYTPYVQHGERTDKIEYVRMKLNDGVLPIAKDLGCNNPGSEYGFCTLAEFLRVLEHAERDAQYERVCFGTEAVKVTGPVTNGNLDFINL